MFYKWQFWLIVALIILGSLSVYGYFKAIPPVIDKNQAIPKIEITPTFFDFGKLDFGKIAEKIFIVKNIGQQVLEIKRVTTSCSCTSAQVSKETINPGEEAELQVRYDTAAMGSGSHGKGQQDRIIYIKSSDPTRPQVEIIISSFVK
ncbi:MAG: DUF1573 domain-containing protein [Candidatus Magasanikbacteria bacterium]|nr:DUF1573 domain-containing protein [Candidatus Magasanikbacteria bacterium]